jgi:putative solute:sodium symporter small subunit
MRVGQTPDQVTAERDGAPDVAVSEPADSKHWSPFSTRRAKWSWGLMAIFTAIYFVVAIVTSAEFASLAATMIFGLPLGFYLGIGLIISGLVITRIYLARIEV